MHHVAITIAARELVEDIYIVTARATLPDSRTDESIGAVPIGGLKGESRTNAMMKAETKAKRRVTLSIIGLGMFDESEVESIPLGHNPLSQGRSGLKKSPAARIRRPPRPDAARPCSRARQMQAHADLPAGFVRMVDINSEPTKNKSVTRYTITLSSGELVTTINAWLASLAKNTATLRPRWSSRHATPSTASTSWR